MGATTRKAKAARMVRAGDSIATTNGMRTVRAVARDTLPGFVALTVQDAASVTGETVLRVSGSAQIVYRTGASNE